MNDILSKITIIIPTYNRPKYALRNMQYWSDKSALVIVIDGSDHPISNEIILNLSPNITYVHKMSSIYERLLLSTEMISTPFAMLCGDDDFMLPSGIIDCINFLEKNPNYSAACGRMIGFEHDDEGLRIWPEKPQHINHVLNQDPFEQRVMFHLENFNVTTIYGVHRKESLIYCLKFSSGYNFSNSYVSETFFEMLSARFGKSAVLKSPCMLSSQENPPVSGKDWDRKVPLSDWYDDPSKAEEVKVYYETALGAFSSIDSNFDKALNEKLIKSATEARMNNSRNYIESKKTAAPKSILDWFRGTILFKIMRYFYRLILNKKTDYRDDFFYSKSKYKFNRLKYEHDVIINSQTENEMIEIFNNVLNFKTNSSSPA